MIERYCDAIALRHSDEDGSSIAAGVASVPIINGDSGTKEHPNPALLDLFTIAEELSTANNLTITLVGALKYGRTVHSLCELLRH